MSKNKANKVLSKVALVFFVLWFGTVLLTKPFDGTQLIAPAVMAVFMVPVFVGILTEKSDNPKSEPTQITEGRTRKYQSSQEALAVAIDLGDKEASRRHKAGR